jgi:hypothetical protein
VIAASLALSVASLLGAALADTSCDALGAALAEPVEVEDSARVAQLERAIGALPHDAQPIAGQLRSLLGKEGGLKETSDALAAVLRDGCAPLSAHAGAPGAEVAALVARDPRFGGIRVGDDVIDRLLDRMWRWFSGFLESEGMRRYAGSARVVYLAALGGGVLFVLSRLVRAWRRSERVAEAARQDARARVDIARKRAAEELLTDAERELARDPHRAAALTVAALLARVGEHVPGAVTPARTSREVLARLDSKRAQVIAPPLQLFDVVYFARPTLETDARALFAEATRAQQALDALAQEAP